MNPRVMKYASQVGFDAGKYTWFDLSDLPKGFEDDLNDYSRSIGWDVANFSLGEIPLPSNDLAIIFERDGEEAQFVITYSKHQVIHDGKGGRYEGPAMSAYHAQYPDPVPGAIICNAKNEHTNSWLHLREDLRKSMQKGDDFPKMCKVMENEMMTKPVMVLSLLNRRALVSQTTLTAYRGEETSPFINKKRRAKNKPPIYSWNTVEIKPSEPRREYQGGTHASPARHERRGHFRKYPSGKIAWVRPTWVGSIERGMVVHDYIPEVRA